MLLGLVTLLVFRNWRATIFVWELDFSQLFYCCSPQRLIPADPHPRRVWSAELGPLGMRLGLMKEKPLTETKFLTDTATIAVFDPTSLRHRNEDTCDWWSIPGDEIEEVREARMVTVDLGADGVTECEIYRDRDSSTAQTMQVVANLETKMGGYRLCGRRRRNSRWRYRVRKQYMGVFYGAPQPASGRSGYRGVEGG